MMRKERLKKMLNILSMIFPPQYIMDKTPEELENLFYEIITLDTPTTKKYLEEIYDKRGYKRVDKELSKSEAL